MCLLYIDTLSVKGPEAIKLKLHLKLSYLYNFWRDVLLICYSLHIQPERGSAVPKFGEWDEKDPSTGEGFTDIFNKVREDKQSGVAPAITSDTGYNTLKICIVLK